MSGPGAAELAAIRALFHPAPRTIYLDTATYGLPPGPTVAAMAEAIAAWQAGTAHWKDDWDEPLEETSALFADLIGAPRGTIARIPQASVGTGLVAARLGPGDEVVVPEDEFTSTLYPLLVAERRGARIRQVPIDRLADSIGPATTLVATSIVQMQTGRMADLPAILGRAEHAGARVLLDGTQSIPFVPLEEHLPRVDYLVCSGYKHLLMPRGASFLYVRRDRWDALEPLNANWRAADLPFGRYFGGPLHLAPDAARFDVSMGWITWMGAMASLRLLVAWKSAGVLPGVVAHARELARRTGVPHEGGTLVSVPTPDPAAAGVALARAGIKAALRGTGIRFAPHVWTTEAEIVEAAEAILPFRG